MGSHIIIPPYSQSSPPVPCMETTELNMLQSGIIRLVPAGCVGPYLLRLKVLAVVKELNMRFGARNKS